MGRRDRAYAAAHGTKCFTEAVAVVNDDVILAAYLDDFQFTSTDAGVTAVPNSCLLYTSSRDGNRRTLGWPEKSNAGIVGML